MNGAFQSGVSGASDGLDGGSGRFPATPTAAQPGNRSNSWFEAMAQAWAEVLDRQAAQVVSLSDEFSQGRDDPGTATQLQAQAQKMSILSTAATTSINSAGQALEMLAKKQ
jgi:hypothetical protein